MTTHHDNSKKASEATSDFKSSEGDDRGRASENETTAPQGGPGRNPWAQEDARNDTYHRQSHNCNDERIPSAGWRDVYQAMGVDER
jgi:hypothetical protein